MDKVNADIWILTETHTSVDPGESYRSVISSERTVNQWGAEVWVAIWTRLPILSIENVWDSRRMCCAKVLTPLGDLIVYGTVMPWLGCIEYLPIRGKAAFLHALENQAIDWSRLRQENPDSGLCIAGDFNQDLGDWHYYGSGDGKAALRQLIEHRELSCLTSRDRDPIPAITQQRRLGIDHIVISNKWMSRLQSVSTAWPDEDEIQAGLTDHFGVVVDLWQS